MWMALAATGLNFLSANESYKADKAQAKAQRAWQAYSNTMTRLSDSVNQNAVTTNQLMAQDAFASQALDLRKESFITQAKVETAAAAAGVKGRSVTQTMFSVQRNAANREAERAQQFQNTMLAFDQQRQNSTMTAAMNMDYSYIPKPKAATYFLNAAQKSMGYFM